jgi:hypothetical protein
MISVASWMMELLSRYICSKNSKLALMRPATVKIRSTIMVVLIEGRLMCQILVQGISMGAEPVLLSRPRPHGCASGHVFFSFWMSSILSPTTKAP